MLDDWGETFIEWIDRKYGRRAAWIALPLVITLSIGAIIASAYLVVLLF
jgi:hypothetical protein